MLIDFNISTCLLQNKLNLDNILFKSKENGKRKQKREQRTEPCKEQSLFVSSTYFLYCMQVTSSNCTPPPHTHTYIERQTLCSFKKKKKKEKNETASTVFHIHELLNIISLSKTACYRDHSKKA